MNNESSLNCSMCGICCKLFCINLNEKEYLSGKYETIYDKTIEIKDFKEAEMFGANLLKQLEDGSCVYLVDKKCSIHKDRPMVCRSFFCQGNEEEFKDMRKIINEAKVRLK